MRRMHRILRLTREELKIEVIKTFPPADEREVGIGDFVRVNLDFNLDGAYGVEMVCLRKGDVVEVLAQMAFGWWAGRKDDGSYGFFPHHIVSPLYDKKETAKAVKNVLKHGDEGRWNRAKLMIVGSKQSGKTSVVRSLMGEDFQPNAERTIGVQLRHSQTFSSPNTSIPSWRRASQRYSKNTVEVAVRLVQTKSFKQRLSTPIVASAGKENTEPETNEDHQEFEVDFSGNTYYSPNYGSVNRFPTPSYFSQDSAVEHEQDALSVFNGAQQGDFDEEDVMEKKRNQQEQAPPVPKLEKRAHEYRSLKSKKISLKIGSRESDDYSSDKTLPPVMKNCEIKNDFKGDLLRAGSEQENRCFYSIWDYSGDEMFTLLHPLFLTKFGIYILVFDMARFDDVNEMRDLKFWLNTCQLHSPEAPILIVGTHLDRINSVREVAEVNNVLRKLINIKHYRGDRADSLNIGGLKRRTRGTSMQMRNSLSLMPFRETIRTRLVRRSNASLMSNNSRQHRSASKSISTHHLSQRISRNKFIGSKRISNKIGLRRRKATLTYGDSKPVYNIVMNKDADLFFFPLDNQDKDGAETIRKAVQEATKNLQLFKQKISLRWLRCLDRMLDVVKPSKTFGLKISSTEADVSQTQRTQISTAPMSSYPPHSRNHGRSSFGAWGINNLKPVDNVEKKNNFATRINMQTVVKIANEIGISDPHEIGQMLECFHEYGAVIYFNNSTALSSQITTNPQWLVNSLSKLILLANVTKPESGNTDDITSNEMFNFQNIRNVGLEKDLNQLLEQKLVSYDLLEYLWGKEDADYLLELSKTMMILSEWEFPEDGNAAFAELQLNTSQKTNTWNDVSYKSNKSRTNIRLKKNDLSRLDIGRDTPYRDEVFLLPSLLPAKKNINFFGQQFEKDFTCVFDFSSKYLPKGIFHKLVCLLVSASQYQNQQLLDHLEKLRLSSNNLQDFPSEIGTLVNKTPVLHSNYAQIWFNDGYTDNLNIARRLSYAETVHSNTLSSVTRGRTEDLLGNSKDEEITVEDCLTLVKDESDQILMFVPKSSPYSPSRNLSRVVSMLLKIEKDLFCSNQKLHYRISLETFDGKFVSYQYASRLKMEPWFKSFFEYHKHDTMNVDGFVDML